MARKHIARSWTLEVINPKLAAHIGKYHGLFARLCIIWHWVESEPGLLPGTITEKTARRVGAFLDGFLLQHAYAFYAGVLGLSNAQDELTAVAGHILAHKLGRLTNRDVQRGTSTMRALDKREFESILDQLDAIGWVNRVPGPLASSLPHGIVNPVVHTKFAERAAEEAERRARNRKLLSDIFAASG
jgi:hypothetical protein